jgi:hypothetical protein
MKPNGLVSGTGLERGGGGEVAVAMAIGGLKNGGLRSSVVMCVCIGKILSAY